MAIHVPGDRQRAEEMTATVQAPRWREAFDGVESEVREVRQWISRLLPACQARADVVLVANELCTNAILHTASGRGGRFVVEIAWYPSTVRVSVADAGAPDGPRQVSDPDEHGRGLAIVQELCHRSGYFGGHRGLLAWAEISWSGPGAVPPPGFGDAYQDTIREGLDILGRAHRGVPTWFGHETRQWWALTGQPGVRRLLAASTPQELDGQLTAMRAPRAVASGSRSSWPPLTPPGSGRANACA